MLCCVTTLHAQQQYTVDGQSYNLKTDIEGQLTLLWNVIDGEYRYFSKKGNEIVELKNTRTGDGYQEEYKETLRLQTGDANMDTSRLKLTLPGLRKFFIAYNKAVDPNFVDPTENFDLEVRLGLLGGVSNAIFNDNPDNTLLPVGAIDLELIEQAKLRRHSLVVRFKQLFKSSDFEFRSSQVSMNYRFKFVQSSSVDIYTNVKFVSYTHVKRDIITVDPNTQQTTVESVSGGDFQTPANFGVGADIPLGNGFITVTYNDIFSIGLDSNGEFPVDFTVGYKINL